MTNQFLDALDCQIQAKHLLTHEFYQAWNRGELSKECLKEYALEYYAHVKAFPGYLLTLLSRKMDAETRNHLFENLSEEVAGSPNHPEMWREFALSLGATDREIDAYVPNMAINHVIDTLNDICKNEETTSAVASLYAYESQIPAVCVSKIKGLKEHYGMKNPNDWKYFSVHIEADKQHAALERAILAKHVSNDNKTEIVKNVDRTLVALWDFLTSLCYRHKITCSTQSI